MHGLALEEGAPVRFRLVTLPRVSSLTVRPSPGSSFFHAVADPKPALEEALRHFTAVTQGFPLVLWVGDAPVEFDVLRVEPSGPTHGACLVDADVQLEIENGAGAAPRQPAGAGGGGLQFGFAPPPPSAPSGPRPLRVGETLTGVLPPGGVAYFTLLLEFPGGGVSLRCESAPVGGGGGGGAQDASSPPPLVPMVSAASVSRQFLHGVKAAPSTPNSTSSPAGDAPGEADLWVSGRGGPSKPGPLGYTWCETSAESTKSLFIAEDDPLLPPFSATGTRALYVAVTGYGNAPLSYTLSAEGVEVEPAPPSLSTGAATAGDAPTRLCPTCKAPIPESASLTHAAFCARHNVVCPVPGCGVVLRVAARDTHIHCEEEGCTAVLSSVRGKWKHVALVHTPIECDRCGQPLLPSAHPLHAAEFCTLRPLPCVYCSMAVPSKRLAAHESDCGGRTAPCDLCGAPVVRKAWARHAALEHGVGDASLYTPAPPRAGAGVEPVGRDLGERAPGERPPPPPRRGRVPLLPCSASDVG